MAEYSFCPLCGAGLKTEHHSGIDRKVCSSDTCGFVHWDNPVPVVAAIAVYGDSVLLVRNMGWPEKIFGLVNGFLEKDESPEEAVIREIQEELGLKGSVKRLIGLYPFSAMNQLIIAYEVNAEGNIELGEELEEYKLVPVEKLRPWPFGTGLAVKDWLESR